MSLTLEAPLIEIDQTWPDNVYVLHHPASDRYGCYRHMGIHGLACFASENGAVRFSEWIELSGMRACELSFEEAREVAKGRPLPVVAIMLLDKMEHPAIHYVR